MSKIYGRRYILIFGMDFGVTKGDIMTLAASLTGLTVSFWNDWTWWNTTAELLRAVILIATVIYVVFRAMREVRRWFKRVNETPED